MVQRSTLVWYNMRLSGPCFPGRVEPRSEYWLVHYIYYSLGLRKRHPQMEFPWANAYCWFTIFSWVHLNYDGVIGILCCRHLYHFCCFSSQQGILCNSYFHISYIFGSMNRTKLRSCSGQNNRYEGLIDLLLCLEGTLGRSSSLK